MPTKSVAHGRRSRRGEREGSETLSPVPTRTKVGWGTNVDVYPPFLSIMCNYAYDIDFRGGGGGGGGLAKIFAAEAC